VSVRVIIGDVREKLAELPDESVHCVVTSPPYFGLRDYGVPGQIGLEPTPDAYVAEMVAVFREVRRVLRKDGVLWLNLGDSYSSNAQTQSTPVASGGWFGAAGGAGRLEKPSEQISVSRPNGWKTGLKPKDLIGIPWRVAFALQADGWWLRQDIIWAKPNPMPESVTDRCTKAHEYVFLLSKSERYWFDAAAIAEPSIDPESLNGRSSQRGKDKFVQHDEDGMARTRKGFQAIEVGKKYETRNRRSVWTITTQPFPEAHFATFPPELPELCIKAGCPVGGTVLDPFGGAGTTGLVADRLGRNAILIELNPQYADMAERRVTGDAPLFADVELA
jgi:DNA modification methylase